MSTVARIVLANRFNQVIAEVDDAVVEEIVWLLNDAGRLRLTFPRQSAEVTADNLRHGNRVLMEFSNGLPAWAGILDPPRTWTASSVSVTGYSGEYLLKYRNTDKGRYFDNDTLGVMFTSLIDEANAITPTGLSVGKVWGGGDVHSPEYHLESLLKIIQSSFLDRLSAADFDVTVTQTAGVLQFAANLYERKGKVLTQVALVEGANVVEAELTEQGPIINAWKIAGADTGSGTGWGVNRLISSESAGRDESSINLYGPREAAEVQGDIIHQATLDNVAARKVAETKNPTNLFSLTVRDAPPARFADYDVGDTIPLLLPSYGFGGTNTSVRLMARQYTPATDTCQLTVQEVL